MSGATFIEKLLHGVIVEWTPLGQVAEFYGGLSGKSKSDFSGGTSKYITYKNIFSNIAVDFNALESVNISPGEQQNAVGYGDVLFTGSSEIADEAGMSSAVTTRPSEPIYLNSFSLGVRFHEDIPLIPEFSKHLFRAKALRTEIARTASGVTRFNISKERLRKVRIPILSPDDPKRSIELQTQIAKILDVFTGLTAELTAALTAEHAARRKQYSYYRDRLLQFEGNGTEWKALGDIGKFIRGKRFTKADFADDGVSAIHYGEIYTRYGVWTDHAVSKIRADMESSLRYARPNDVVITAVGETVEDVGKAVAWIGDSNVAIHDDSYAFRHSLNPKYIAYAMQTAAFIDEKAKHVSRGKVNRLLVDGVAKVRIPIPYPNDTEKSLAEQARIVAILDKFDAVTRSINEDLPREINLRRKQYEYYRDLLLTFPKPDEVVA